MFPRAEIEKAQNSQPDQIHFIIKKLWRKKVSKVPTIFFLEKFSKKYIINRKELLYGNLN